MSTQEHSQLTQVDLAKKNIEKFLTGGRPKLLRLAVSRGGKPHVSSVWYLWKEGRIWISTAEDRLKVKIIRQNPNVALIVDTDTQPYQGLIMEGRAKLTKRKVREVTYEIANRYVAKSVVEEQFESLMRAPRILISVEPEKAIDIMSYRDH
jgi:PPOX class probable F420-dependent enzyme